MLLLLAAALLAASVAGGSLIYEDPAADRAIRQAMDATYRLDLVEARRAARALQSRFPDHPVGYVLDAETYWWEAQADPASEEIEDEYFRVQERAVDIGEKALKAGKYPAIEIKAYLASAWGSKARFRLTQHGVGLKTVLDGRNAHGYAEDVYEEDPNYTDILVGIGAYNYFAGNIPGILKPFAWLLGGSGDAALGLKQLRTAIEKGRYARTEGRIVLFTALMQDKQYADSWSTLQGLMADYPENYALYPWATEWHRDQGKSREGARYFEKLHSEKLSGSRKLAQYALFERAVLQNAAGQKDEARTTLARLSAMGSPDAALSRTIRDFEKNALKK